MRPLTLTPLDYAIMALFAAGIAALGFSARLRENSTLQLVAAGRRLTLPLFVATLVSTWYGGILGVGESASYYGLGTWLLFGAPYYVFAVLYAFVLAPRVRAAPEISIPERLHARFGRGAGITGAALVFLLAVPAAHVLMLGVLARSVFGGGWPQALLVAIAVGAVFLYRGGLLADARVSLLSFVMMFVGFGTILAYCLVAYPAERYIGAIPNKALLSLTGGQGPLVIASFFVLGAWTLVDPAFHQRVASATDSATGRKGVLVSVGFWVLSDLLLVGVGMYGIALLGSRMPENPLFIYPALGEAVLPPGLKALFICGMAGTVLTALVGYTLVSGATFGRELIGRLRPAMTDEAKVKWSRLGLFIAGGVAFVLALEIKSVVALWYSWAGAIIGSLLAPVCCSYGLIRLRSGSGTVVVSMLVAFGVTISWLVYGISNDNPFLEVAVAGEKVSLGTLAPGIVASAAVLAIGEAIAWIKT